MQYSFDVGAFIVSIFALGLAAWNSIRQSKLEKEQAQLNKLLIARETRDQSERDQARLNLQFIKDMAGHSHLIISNDGQGIARDIRFDPTKFGMLFGSQDLESFPISQLDPGRNIEIKCFPRPSIDRVHLKLTWKDAAGNEQRRDFNLSPSNP